MKKTNWPVGAHGVRPAGPPDRCFYCGERVADQHHQSCVIREKTVIVRYSFEVLETIPEHWTAEDFERAKNQGSWCFDNAFNTIDATTTRMNGEESCTCGLGKAEFVREATEEDEAHFKLSIKDRPG